MFEGILATSMDKSKLVSPFEVKLMTAMQTNNVFDQLNSLLTLSHLYLDKHRAIVSLEAADALLDSLIDEDIQKIYEGSPQFASVWEVKSSLQFQAAQIKKRKRELSV
jgi:hypothetical protein